MASNKVNARIQMKRDTAANWTSKNPVLLNGERIIVDTASGEMRYKVGDGIKTFTELPFDDEIMRVGINAAQATADTALEMVNVKLDEFQGAENADKLLGIDSDGYVTVVSKPVNATQSAHGLMSASDKTKLDNIEAGAQANQNAFSNIAIGSTTISADSASDTLTLASGSNVTISANANNDKITISAANTNTTYTLEKNGRNIVLTGSDGSSTSVTDSDTTYTLASFGVNASAEELNYSDGLTGNIQDQLDAKVSTSRTINGKALTANVSLSASDVGADVDGSASNALASAKDYTDEHIANVQNPHYVTKAQIGLGSVENKSSATIRNELTSANVVAALGYTPPTKDTTYNAATSDAAGLMSAEDKTVLGRIDDTYISLVPYGTPIPDNADLNTVEYLAVGNFYCSTSNGAASLTNCPTTHAFMMQVYSPLAQTIGDETTRAWNYRVRKLMTYQGVEYVQHVHSEGTAGVFTYDSWVKIVKAGDLATSTKTGLMRATDKAKLDGIEEGANKIVVDDTMSSTSTNPVQNNVVNSAISNSASSTLSASKSYTDTAISNLINSAPTTLDTLGEIAAAMEENEDVVSALETAIGTKAATSDLSSHTGNKSNPHGVSLSQLGVTATAAELNIMDGVTATASEINKLDGLTVTTTELNALDGITSNIQAQLDGRSVNGHSHEMITVVGLRDALDGKAALEHGNHVPATETANNAKFLRNDNTWATVTPANIGAATSGHTHSSYANQNAFSNVTIGSTTIAADTTTDTLTLVAGSNITLTADGTNDKITIAATDTVYTHPASSGNKHIPAGGSSGQILRWSADGTAAWGADNNTTYSAATQSASGLMSAADKTKLDGIATGANAYSLPTASSSTLGGVKTTSTVTSTSGLTACPIISGVPYYKDTNTTYSLGSFGVTATAAELNTLDGITATTAELNFVDGVTSNIQTQLDGKAASSHGTHVSFSTTAPAANGSASAGSASTVARSDHVHPLQTSVTGSSGSCTGNAATATNVAWSGVTSKPSYYDAKAIKGITRSGTTFTYTCMDGTTGTFTQQDSNTTYSTMTGASSSAAGAAGLVPAPAAGKQTSFLRGDGTWVVPTNTTYSAATTSSAGLMSAADKSKLDAITASADSVSFSRSLTSGTKIGTITINGTGTDLYCETNTNTTYSNATISSLGLVRVGYGALSDRPSSASTGAIYFATS